MSWGLHLATSNGEVVHFVHRHQIEGQSAGSVARDLVQGFERFC